ncbi:MAG: hypothetical protein U5L08_07365 [Xanthomonadales bacterium]|nr:hypothetical protein [Xanthomonadales bacterium]
MAFALKFTGMKWQDGKYGTSQAPGEVSGEHIPPDDTRFRKIALTAGYIDCFAVLSVDEALNIASAHYKTLPQSFGVDAHSKHPEENLREVHRALEDADFVIAHLFEWDSGLG